MKDRTQTTEDTLERLNQIRHQAAETARGALAAHRNRTPEDLLNRFDGGPISHRIVHQARRYEEFEIAPLSPFTIGSGGEWPCYTAFYGTPFDVSDSWPSTPQVTAAPQGGVEGFMQAFPTDGRLEVQGILWKDDPAVKPDLLRKIVSKTAYAYVGKKLSMPAFGSKVRVGVDALVTGYSQALFPSFLPPAGTGDIWLSVWLDAHWTGGSKSGPPVYVLQRSFGPNVGYDVTPARINQAVSLTLDVPSVAEVWLEISTLLAMDLSLDSNLYLGANFSGVMNTPADIGGAITAPAPYAWVYC